RGERPLPVGRRPRRAGRGRPVRLLLRPRLLPHRSRAGPGRLPAAAGARAAARGDGAGAGRQRPPAAHGAAHRHGGRNPRRAGAAIRGGPAARDSVRPGAGRNGASPRLVLPAATGPVGWVEVRDPPQAWWVSYLDPPYENR